MLDLFNFDKSRGAIFRKYIIYVDVIFGENGFEPSQKLNSFFGQTGIYEGHDRIIGHFEWLFKTNQFFYFIYKIKEEHDETYFFEENHVENEENNLKEYDEEALQDSENKSGFFAPILVTFYFGEKKVDFSMLNCFRKNYYFKNQSVINCLNFLKFKEKHKCNYDKNFFYNLLNKRHSFFNNFEKIYKVNNYFYSLLNKTSIDFFKNDNFLFSYYKQLLNYFGSKELKIFVFKKILYKKNFSLLSNLKKMKWFRSPYLLNLILYKNFWFINKIKHHNLINSSFCFISQLNSIKKKFLKRFKRKKKYKKNVNRDFFGKKNIYERVFNTIEENKKKKR